MEQFVLDKSPSLCSSPKHTLSVDCTAITKLWVRLTFNRTWPDSSIVIGLRAFLSVLIAISVAALPAIAEVIVLPSPDQVTMADQAEMPCCPSCDTQGDKATACVLKCVAVAGAVLPAMPVALLFVAEGPPPILAEHALYGLVRAPPTHPPPA
jgi:hypothetical protein